MVIQASRQESNSLLLAEDVQILMVGLGNLRAEAGVFRGQCRVQARRIRLRHCEVHVACWGLDKT